MPDILQILIGQRDQYIDNGQEVPPQLKKTIARVGYMRIHDRHYKRLNTIGKWLHRLLCPERHR